MPAAVDEDLAAARAELKEAKDLLRKAERTPVHTARAVPGAAPHVTTGPVLRDSRGLSVGRLLAHQVGLLGADQVKDDLHYAESYRKALADTRSQIAGCDDAALPLLLSSSLMPAAVFEHEGGQLYRKALDAGVAGYDPDEAAWLNRRFKTAMSYLSDSTGGAMVAPPVQGELIELMRPVEAVMGAGATQITLPPNGKITFPRQTAPTSGYWVGENTEITESNPTLGTFSLQGKKVAGLVTVPNELLKFATPSADGLIRSDLAKTLGLAFDYACLYGAGGAHQPKGLVLYTGTNQLIDYAASTPTPSGVDTNGNTVQPQDGYRMAGLVEDRNFQFSGWLMRPLMWASAAARRADAVSAADAKGPFVQDLTRPLGFSLPKDWCGYPVHKSAVVRNNQVKGSSGATLTEIWGGQWEHFLQARYGTIELSASRESGDSFKKDQTQIRAIMFCDAAPRYEGAFAYYKQLLVA